MNPIRRELLNGLFVLVVASLLSAASAAFQVSFNLLIWILILIGIGIAVGFYVIFELTLRSVSSAEDREKEWLKRVGTPAPLELIREGRGGFLASSVEALNAMSPGSDLTVMFNYGPEGARTLLGEQAALREAAYSNILERLKQGKIREYKRIICFDPDVFANDHELRSGVLHVGEGPGTVHRVLAEHCRLMMATKGCSVYVAPAVLQSVVVFYGPDKVSMSVQAREPATGGARSVGSLFFCDPPNGDIVHELWDMERETERRMVAVHKIVFPEDEQASAAATR